MGAASKFESTKHESSLPIPIQAHTKPLSFRDNIKNVGSSKYSMTPVLFLIWLSYIAFLAFMGDAPQDPRGRLQHEVVLYIAAMLDMGVMLLVMFWTNRNQWAMKTDSNGKRRITSNAMILLTTYSITYALLAYSLWLSCVKFKEAGGHLEEVLPLWGSIEQIRQIIFSWIHF